MQTLKIEGTDDSPGIILDKQNALFEITGRSLPEDSAEFYTPVLDWISAYSKAPNASTAFTFKLEYANTSSSKFIHEILHALEKIKGVKIIWCYMENDEDMQNAGMEFSEQVDIPFEFNKYS